MLGWLYRLIVGTFGCNHTWETLSEKEFRDTSFSKEGIHYVKYRQRCTKCGTIQHVNHMGWIK